MAGEFWLNDRQWAAIDPLLPKTNPALGGRMIVGLSAASSMC
jgi:hypothetical protein